MLTAITNWEGGREGGGGGRATSDKIFNPHLPGKLREIIAAIARASLLVHPRLPYSTQFGKIRAAMKKPGLYVSLISHEAAWLFH